MDIDKFFFSHIVSRQVDFQCFTEDTSIIIHGIFQGFHNFVT